MVLNTTKWLKMSRYRPSRQYHVICIIPYLMMKENNLGHWSFGQTLENDIFDTRFMLMVLAQYDNAILASKCGNDYPS